MSTPEQLWGALGGENPPSLRQVLGSGPSPRVPFVLAGHQRTEVSGDGLRQRQKLIDAVVHAAPVLVEVDPRGLRATQGGLDRDGVVHYLGAVFHERGTPTPTTTTPATPTRWCWSANATGRTCCSPGTTGRRRPCCGVSRC